MDNKDGPRIRSVVELPFWATALLVILTAWAAFATGLVIAR